MILLFPVLFHLSYKTADIEKKEKEDAVNVILKENVLFQLQLHCWFLKSPTGQEQTCCLAGCKQFTHMIQINMEMSQSVRNAFLQRSAAKGQMLKAETRCNILTFAFFSFQTVKLAD